MVQKPLKILYEDAQILAVNKPSGLLMHLSDLDKQEDQTLEGWAAEQFGTGLHLVHRLDKPTSGVVLLAKNKETASKLGELFAAGGITKTYRALVRGYTEESGVIDHPLKDLQQRMYRTALGNKPPKPAKEAQTAYQRLGTYELPYPSGRYDTTRYSLVSASPLTGRYRQIRRHMKHIFHPILGDTSHGDGKQNDFFRLHFGVNRLMLHAHSLSITAEFLTEKSALHIQASLPADFKQVMGHLAAYSTSLATRKP